MFTEAFTVDFHGHTLVTAQQGDVVYVAMKPVVEGMGLDWGTQYRKLMSQNDKFNCCHMTMAAEDGKSREMLCIPLEKLNGWLFSVNPEKVRPEIREIVILYQEECFVVLYQYWHKGAAINPRFHTTTDDVQPVGLTLKQWLALTDMKRKLLFALERTPPSAHATLLTSLKKVCALLGEALE